MDWRVYYADGSTWDDQVGPWEDAPVDGVVCVNVLTKDGFVRYTLNGLNFYYLPEDAEGTDITHTNDIGPQLRKRCRWLKHGVGLSREKWQDVLERATHDPDFPHSRHPMRRSTDCEG